VMCDLILSPKHKVMSSFQQLACPQNLLSTLQSLRQQVLDGGHSTFSKWQPHIQRSEFLSSALNLACYLALRHHDLREIQLALMPWGLSSLGRIESRVLPNLDAVIATLESLCGQEHPHLPHIESFFEGNRLLQLHTDELFGPPPSPKRRVRIMVTLPTEAASDYSLVRDIIKRGANCLRINCAHDDPQIWLEMITQIQKAKVELARSCKLMMDLAGAKIRTIDVLTPIAKNRVFREDLILLSRQQPGLHKKVELELDHFQIYCSNPEVLDQLKINSLVYIDDGKICTKVIDTDYLFPDKQKGLLLQVTQTKPKGVKLQSQKGLNFPGTKICLSPLSDKDLSDLDFVARYADIIGYSFVQNPADIELLQQELSKRNVKKMPAIVAKIETATAVRNLPELIVHAAGKQSFGVMIARGDLAVEIGYQRLTEIQEEILWLCEAANIPVIWATQVLESLVKNGAPSRSEMTDAAMAQRAECVMLNKGPFLCEAITILNDVLSRMEAHQLKKTPQLRALHSW